MALSTPLAPPTTARTTADLAYVTTHTAPGYCVRSRALDLSSAEGVAVALVHSPYALAKLADGRFLAARAARESDDGFIELGFSHTGSSADVCHWVKVSAGETLDSLVMDTVTHLWLGFFNGPAETPKGRCVTLEPDGGSAELGVRHVMVELEAEAGSSRLRSARRTITQWLEEAAWQPPLGLLTHKGHRVGGKEGKGVPAAAEDEPMMVQLAHLKVLRQVLRLVDMVEKGARQWDASGAGSFLEAALGSRPAGKSATTSAAVRLNSKVELSARRKRAFITAVETGGVPMGELSAEDKGVLVRDHLIPSSTPNPTPQRSSRQPRGGAKKDPSENEGEAVEGSDDSSASTDESSESDELTTPRRGRKSASRAGRGPLSGVESESGEEDVHTQRAAKRVRLAPSTELREITPPGLEAGEAVKIFFKSQLVQEASSFTIPDDFDDEDEREAYLERAGRAMIRLKESYGCEWMRGAKPRDKPALRSMREELVDLISRGAAGHGGQGRGVDAVCRSLQWSGAQEPTQVSGERDTLSGAAALPGEQQLGAVAADVAERLHRQAAAIPPPSAGDVGAGLRMAPDSLRDDLARAVGSNGRVDATGERSQNRTTLPAAVKRLGASLTDSVQQSLLDLPASDESGLQYINPPAARKLAMSAVTGQIRVSEFVKETRQLLGSAAPAKESLDELREAWRVMRTALMAATIPLGLLTATDVGLAKLDARVGATATSTRVGPKCLAAWLRRVTDSWETQCIRFRQLDGARPSLAECVQQHDAFIATRTQAAALRAVLRPSHQEGRSGKRDRVREGDSFSSGEGKRSLGAKQRRGGRRRGGQDERESGESDSGGGGHVDVGTKSTRRCAWPDKPRLPDDKFREFRADCRKLCPDACFAFLVGTCKEASCTKSHEVPPAFESVKRKFR